MPQRVVIGLIALLLFVSYGYMHPPWGYNQATRLDVLHAIFSEGTVAIDSYHENTGDKIQIGDHYYSEKAPGVVAIAIPAFAFSKAILSVFYIDIDSDIGWKISEWITTLFSVGLLAIISALAFFQLLRRVVPSSVALTTLLAVYLGSITFTYASMLFSHTAVIALFAIALWALDVSVGLFTSPSKPFSNRHLQIAGLCMGLAIASEFTSAIAAGVMFVYLASASPKAGVKVALYSLIPILLIPLNNWLITGNPFTLPYGFVTDFPGMQQGFFGVQFSSNLKVLSQLLISEYRGLLFWTPFFLLAIPGYVVLWKQHRPLLLLMAGVPIAYLLFISSYPYWHGGWALGPRHLASIIPFVAIVATLGMQKYRRVGYLLAGLSVALTGTATLLNPLTPEGKLHPLSEVYLPILKEGNVRDNLGKLMGLEGLMSLVPLILVVSVLILLLIKGTRSIDTKTAA